MRSTETERMLRLRDVARLPAEVLVKRFEEDFGNLVTAAVADATRRLALPSADCWTASNGTWTGSTRWSGPKGSSRSPPSG
ncbi:hypothetical protein ACFQVA_38320 [Actinomadura keratinilytica]